MRLALAPVHREDLAVWQFHALGGVAVAAVYQTDVAHADGKAVSPVVLVGLDGDWFVIHGILSPGLAARLGWLGVSLG